MKRSSSGAADQPAGSTASMAGEQSPGSAEQPVTCSQHAGTQFHAVNTQPPTNTNASPTRVAEPLHRFEGLKECSDWLKALPEHVVSQSRPLHRVRSVTALLQMPASSQQREEIQSLLKEWCVPQKHKGRKRNVDDVKTDLVSRVVEETSRLRTMHDATGAPIPAAPANSPTWAKYSAVQSALQKDTARHKG